MGYDLEKEIDAQGINARVTHGFVRFDDSVIL